MPSTAGAIRRSSPTTTPARRSDRRRPNASVRVLIGSKVQTIPLETYVRGVVSAEMPAELAAGGAGGTGDRQPYVRTDRPRGRVEVRRVRRHALAGVSRRGRRNRTDERRGRRDHRTDRHLRGPSRDHLLLRQLGRDDRETCRTRAPAPNSQPWLLGVPDPYDVGPQFDWKLSMSFATASARLRGLVKGRLRGIEVLTRGVSPRILTAATSSARAATPR